MARSNTKVENDSYEQSRPCSDESIDIKPLDQELNARNVSQASESPANNKEAESDAASESVSGENNNVLNASDSSNTSSPEENNQSSSNVLSHSLQKETSNAGQSNASISSHEPTQASKGNVVRIKTLSQLTSSSDSDCFVQLVSIERLNTKDGKPYFKALFRDRKTSIQTILWNDNPLFRDCEKNWKIGAYYKLRASIHESNYGVKLEIRRIRQVTQADKEDGFERNKCRPSSDLPPETISAELLSLASVHIGKSPLLRLIQKIFKERRFSLYESPASRFHHRNYIGGLLEHTLSVTKIAIFLCDHFCACNPSLKNRFSKPLVVAGAILHDVGKILDTIQLSTGAKHTIAGDLIGHAVLGVEIIREYAKEVKLDSNTLIQLEHLILTHARFADWGAPMPPSTLEAMTLHYADYADSTFASALNLLETDRVSNENLTMHKGPFGTPIFKPLFLPDSDERPVSQTSTTKTGETNT